MVHYTRIIWPETHDYTVHQFQAELCFTPNGSDNVEAASRIVCAPRQMQEMSVCDIHLSAKAIGKSEFDHRITPAARLRVRALGFGPSTA